MYHPETTYRIQFHKNFTFRHLEQIIPYLHRLGIKTIYASPIFMAVPGSLHGYDGIDPNRINPEIGSLEQFRSIAQQLKRMDMGWIQDFVPNHMAFNPLNPWLYDFLEKGEMSCYRYYFDVNGDQPLMVPFLDSDLEEVLQKGQLQLVYHRGQLQLHYQGTRYPLNYKAWSAILSHPLCSAFRIENDISLLAQLAGGRDPKRFAQLWQEFIDGLQRSDRDHNSLYKVLILINKDAEWLRTIVQMQFYRLCNWQETDSRINYRRFFIVNGLISVSMERPEVFADYHKLLFSLVRENCIQGIRIDHIDGLYDPDAYLVQLRDNVGPEVYLVVEKIVEAKEKLPQRWPVEGNSGYDFLQAVNGLLTCKRNADVFREMYNRIAADPDPVALQVQKAKHKILHSYMEGDLDYLLSLFLSLPELVLPPTVSRESLRGVIAAVLAAFPVYRFYTSSLPLQNEELALFQNIIYAVKRQEQIHLPSLNFFARFFLSGVNSNSVFQDALQHFWRRYMQFTGPLMAKGIEDTWMYTHATFIALNEVGYTPGYFGSTVASFHRDMLERQQKYPFSINATSTHDTKRGEDSRARLLSLSSLPDLWQERMFTWLEQQPATLTKANRYFVLQALVGALPWRSDENGFRERVKDYLIKFSREAKQFSSWEAPNESYEQELIRYAFSALDPKGPLQPTMYSFVQEIQQKAVCYALMQIILKCTCPGIPDIYQGSEIWDLSFVDPDNRRTVDFVNRAEQLEKISGNSYDQLMEHPEDGLIKLFVLQRLLLLRRNLPELFHKGIYQPLATSNKDNASIAYCRRSGRNWLLVVLVIGTIDEGSITVQLPVEAPDTWTNLFTGQSHAGEGHNITFSSNNNTFWVLHSSRKDKKREAGILLPLFSLPSPYGIGGLGKEAFSFAEFLARSGQRLWQILPLNPLLRAAGYSPYTSSSAFAGATVYIDLRELVDRGLLTQEELGAAQLPETNQVDYVNAMLVKEALLQKAWTCFKSRKRDGEVLFLENFCRKESAWLDDYALHYAITISQNGAAWYNWPDKFRDRDPGTLIAFAKQASELILKVKWEQFLFHRQWRKLKDYCRQLDIGIIGDLPFYMNRDAVDVWVNRDYFKVDHHGNALAVAGVPPDYFSAEGQLWGMPTYNWPALESRQYDWWLQRLEKNLTMYDWLRLDHFRAFYDYWEIKGDATSARQGVWQPGPQNKLFDLIRTRLGLSSFIAEDLGEIHEEVFRFREQYHLPGMRVLQFGFTPYDPELRDVPHNYEIFTMAYTGTHDNDTLLGWFRSLHTEDKQQLDHYTGYPVHELNIADAMIRLLYQSTAAKVIIPLQDVLGLDSEARINIPSTSEQNWLWRVQSNQLYLDVEKRLLQWATLYNR